MFEYLDLLMFLAAIIFLLRGFPVAFTLAGVGILFALLGMLVGSFDPSYFLSYPKRIFGIMTNEVLIAVPLFIFMGVMLERSRVAEDLLETMGSLFGPLRGGLGISVSLVGGLLAASTGIVGATVVTMGLLSLPTMLRRGYSPSLACGTICAAGTLGQIIPPSIVLVILGDQISNSYQAARLEMGDFSPAPVSVGDLFAGALIPGITLVGMYILYQVFVAWKSPESCPAIEDDNSNSNAVRALLTVLGLFASVAVFMVLSPAIGIVIFLNIAIVMVARKDFIAAKESDTSSLAFMVKRILSALVPPLALIITVLGSILQGIATPTEAAAVGAVGALFLAALRLGPNAYQQQNTPSTTRNFDRAPIALLGFIGKSLDHMRNLPIYAAVIGIIDMLYLSSTFDLRLTRDVIDPIDQYAIWVAMFLFLLVAWGVVVSVGRIAASRILQDVMRSTTKATTMVFIILIGAALFSLVFRGLGGEEKVHTFLSNLPGGPIMAIIVVMLVMFFLGFFLDFLEIVFVVVPIVAPVLFKMDFNPIWLGIMMAINLQTSFLTPPFGFALFYLRGVAPPEITTGHIYKGVIPFIIIQMLTLVLLSLFPAMATWLPSVIYG